MAGLEGVFLTFVRTLANSKLQSLGLEWTLGQSVSVWKRRPFQGVGKQHETTLRLMDKILHHQG